MHLYFNFTCTLNYESFVRNVRSWVSFCPVSFFSRELLSGELLSGTHCKRVNRTTCCTFVRSKRETKRPASCSDDDASHFKLTTDNGLRRFYCVCPSICFRESESFVFQRFQGPSLLLRFQFISDFPLG